MIEIGKKQQLVIDRIKPHGAYLVDPQDEGEGQDVLLPRKEIQEFWKPGSVVDVFVYRDSDDRLIATTRTPHLTMGEFAVLTVKDVTKIGAFLDWGLEKDILLPYAEQVDKPQKGNKVLVRLYVDKSGRLAASQKLGGHLQQNSPYKVNDWVEGRAISNHPKIGIFVAVEDKYEALLPLRNKYCAIEPGSVMKFRVQHVDDEGRLVLSLKDRKEVELDSDATRILEKIDEHGGFLPFNDDTDPKLIQQEFLISKSAFKRAVGRLLKQDKIRFIRGGIARTNKGGNRGRRR